MPKAYAGLSVRIREMSSQIFRDVRNKVKLYDDVQPIFEHFDAERQLNNIYRRKVWLNNEDFRILHGEPEA